MRPKVRKGLHGRKGELSMNKKKLPLAFWIFIGLVVGIAVGLAGFPKLRIWIQVNQFCR